MPKAQNIKVFINYRQRISRDQALELKERINQLYANEGDDVVFVDTESIDTGQDWPLTIREALEQAQVFLALLGPGWFKETHPHDEYTYRLKDENDWVRNEIIRALAKEKEDPAQFVIFPLNYGVKYPDHKVVHDFLPPELIPFFKKQCLDIRPEHYVEDLINVLRKIGERINKTIATPALSLATPRKRLPVPEKYRRPQSKAPFIGLTPFTQADCALFFGRDREISELLGKIQASPLVLLTGKSGAGKSSLLDAGVLPRLEAQFRLSELPRRRDKAQGLHQQLQAILVECPPGPSPSLYILDQVEEMYTNEPMAGEPEALVELIRDTLQTHPAARIVLGYRKEFHKDLSDLLFESRPEVFELKSLDREGLLAACRSVAADPELAARYADFSLEDGLAERIVAEVLRDNNSSHSAPLLQVQLTKMWEIADAARQRDEEPIRFTQQLYEQVATAGLRELLQTQLAQLEQHGCGQWLRSGLALDVLQAHVTDRGTAGACKQEDLAQRYTPESLRVLLPALQRLHLLNAEQIKRQAATRLAHDALAPLVLDLFLHSEAPGQRAHRILEAKKNVLPAEHTPDAQRRQVFSPSDLELMYAGLEGMARTDPAVLQQMDFDQRTYSAQSRQRYELAMREARENLENFRADRCLENLQLAAQEAECQPESIQQLTLELAWHEQQARQEQAFQAVADFWQSLQSAEGLELDYASLAAQLATYAPTLWADLQYRYLPHLIPLPAGTFQMGSEEGYEDEKPVHPVTLSAFQLADTPVTWWQYGLFCQHTGRTLPNDSGFGKGDRPVINTSWKDAQQYCNWLSAWQGLSPAYDWAEANDQYPTCDWAASGYRLPTEAEWEYAAQEGEAGKPARFGNGKSEANPTEMNYDAASAYNTQDWAGRGEARWCTTPVRQFAPNARGLYDLSGNVWERCWDIWSEKDYYQQCAEGVSDPRGTETEAEYYRVVRGGSWSNYAYYCRASCRNRYRFVNRSIDVGFRLARS
jgi:formylglycine-generating enzyme required for sulfatase activity